MRVLNANVEVDGTWWGPAYGNAADVPAEVAEKITANVWTEWDEPSTTPAPDVPSLDEWLAASTGAEVLAFVDDWVSAEERDQVLLEFLALERDGEGREDVMDVLVAALPPVPMTPEELAEVARREVAQEAAGDSGSTPPQTTAEPSELTGESGEFVAWVHDSTIDQIEENVASVEPGGARNLMVERILTIDAEGKARKSLTDRLTQYVTES